LFDPARSDRRDAGGVWQRPFGPWSDRLVRALGRLRMLGTAYIPHQRINPRLMREVRRARRIAYLDDGLDTLRRVPHNFDIPGAAAGATMPRVPYLTFHEHRSLPLWLDAFDLQRVCSIRELANGRRGPAIDPRGVEHLFVESPGLDVGEVIAALGIDPERALCVRHPVPHKRGPLPPRCRAVDGRGHALEATVLAARSMNLYFGSTMALVFALLTGAARHNRVYVQLDDAQRENLLLPGDFEVEAGAVALRHPLMRARTTMDSGTASSAVR
ncbi:MAG TPA: hypothetical protein VLE94_15235, partial [Burkholderiaceae bacterium]|nr:hypothetical protein [Burkholderiaceae bacterium]